MTEFIEQIIDENWHVELNSTDIAHAKGALGVDLTPLDCTRGELMQSFYDTFSGVHFEYLGPAAVRALTYFEMDELFELEA